jgi:hypothetical protein
MSIDRKRRLLWSGAVSRIAWPCVRDVTLTSLAGIPIGA